LVHFTKILKNYPCCVKKSQFHKTDTFYAVVVHFMKRAISLSGCDIYIIIYLEYIKYTRYQRTFIFYHNNIWFATVRCQMLWCVGTYYYYYICIILLNIMILYQYNIMNRSPLRYYHHHPHYPHSGHTILK